jgi:hypothetical protein
MPKLPPGSAQFGGFYFESHVSVLAVSSGFTRRWSGDPQFPDNGTAYLQPSERTQLGFQYVGGSRRFDAVSVDLALYSTASLEPVTVRFLAYSYGSPSFAATEFEIRGAVDGLGRPAFQTFYFPPEFRGMYSLHVAPTGALWSLDNLAIFIPEPSAEALLGLGLGGLLVARRHRRGPAGPEIPAGSRS